MHGVAIATCSQGRTFEMEFVMDGARGFGIARDNDGNVYRVVF